MTKKNLARVLFWALVTSSALVMPLALPLSAPALADTQPSNLAVEAAQLALKGDFEGAGQMAARSHDEAAIKLVELIFLRDRPNDAGYSRIMDFLNVAPKWPLTESLMKRAERALYTNNEGARMVLDHFANRTPVTLEGALALARAKLASADRAGADALVQQVWSDPDLNADLERQAASEFGPLIGPDDNKRRMWRLVYAQEPSAAVRMSKRLDGGYQAAEFVHDQHYLTLEAPRRRLSGSGESGPAAADRQQWRRQAVRETSRRHARRAGHEVRAGEFLPQAGSLWRGARRAAHGSGGGWRS